MPEAPLYVVAAAIIRDGRVLSARRPLEKRNGGAWELPGGKVELGETEEQALTREIDEELLCKVRPLTRLGETLCNGLRVCGWRCELVDGEPTRTEHIDMRGLAPHELQSVSWTPADVPLLRFIFR